MAPLDQFIEYQIYLYIFRVFLPILLITGTVGNAISLIVLMQSKHRCTSIARVLIVLSFSDLFMLCVFTINNWLPVVFGLRIRSSSDAACKVLVFLALFLGQLSILCIVALTLNRFIFVLLPFKAKLICTSRNTNILLAGIATLSLLVSCHTLIGLGVNEQGTCTQIKEIYDTVIMKLWVNLHISLFVHTPIIIVIAGNICILVKLIRQSKKFTSVDSKRLKTTSKTTKMLTLLSFVYLALISPIGMFNLKYNGKQLDFGMEHTDAFILLLYALSTTAFMANCSLNCFFYFFMGSIFRKDVKKIFCGKQ